MRGLRNTPLSASMNYAKRLSTSCRRIKDPARAQCWSCWCQHSLYNLAEALLEAGDEVSFPFLLGP